MPKKSKSSQGEKNEFQEEGKASFKSIRGMRDILPENQPYWNKIRKTVEKIAYDYNYHRIDTPLVEPRSLFERTTGENTDVVEKEMYKFKTRGGEDVSLRPEGTPGVVRAYIQHGMRTKAKPVKLYYIGPMYRYDRPQKGRYREFYQFGFEAFGEKDPVLDAQLIQLSLRILKSIGLKNLNVHLNSIGCAKCRPEYNNLLKAYLKNREKSLCMDCKERLKKNPLRVLDCKEEKCCQVISQAPQSVDHLCKDCKKHFTFLLECLDQIGISYEIDSGLVRGLDYYTRTVFEIFSGEDKEKKTALGGGGRYDYLVEKLGGKKTSAIGFAMGMDRIIEEMKEKDVKGYNPPRPKVFLAQLGDMAKMKSLKVFQDLEKAGITVAESFGKGGLRTQLKRADKIGAEVVLIIGQREALDETVIVKEMLGGNQETVSFDKIVNDVKKKLDKIKKERRR